MLARIRLPALGLILLLAACTPHRPAADSSIVLDERVALVRGAEVDSAHREIVVADDSYVVAIADEQLTDVKLKVNSHEVENHLHGAGLEIATVFVPAGSQVTVTLTSAPDGATPGTVPVRVTLYSAAAASKPEFAARIKAFTAWSDGTSIALRPDSFTKTGQASLDTAIDSLESKHGDAALAAEARLVEARALHYYKIDWRAARAQAQRAAQAFVNLPRPDPLNAARANYIEALALVEMSEDGKAVDPTANEARKLTRDLFSTLTAPTSVLGPVERARALTALGQADLNMNRTEEAGKHFEQARAIYAAEGRRGSEREARFMQPIVLVVQGRFTEAASAFDPLLPELSQIADQEFLARVYFLIARAQAMSGRVDEGIAMLFRALPLVREQQYHLIEAWCLQMLAFIYDGRGDFQQATAFYDEALKISRELKDTTQYALALTSAAGVARLHGDFDLALKLAQESIRVSSTPIARARTPLELGLYYRAKDDIPAAIAAFRQGLAVDLGDPRHHAHTDGRIDLALALLDLEPHTAKDSAEAATLIADALETSIRVHDTYREMQARRAQAQADAQAGRTSAALAGYIRTLQLSQEWRDRSTSTEVRASMLKDEQHAFRGLLDIALAEVARRPAGALRAASPAELAALLRLERARQRSFSALRVGTLDSATSAHVDDLLQQMGQKSLRIATLLNQKLDAPQTTELAGLQLDMSRLHAELDNVRWSAAAKNAQAEAAMPHAAPGWRPLAPHSVQLSYAFGEQHVYALVRSESGTRVTALAPSRKQLEEQLTALAALDVRTQSREMETALGQVSAALLPAGLLPKDSSAVQIVAEGRIASVPFSGLRSPTDPARRLVETHDVSMVTTLLGVDEAPRQATRPYRFVALASGHGTYRAAADIDPTPQLHAATTEISTAAAMFTARDPAARIKLLTGAAGSAATMRDIWASGADVVHFATHALADLHQPIASLLVLPAIDANGKATYLTAGQVQAWRGDTELVFLSACESAIGPPQYAAGMPGLQRAFLRAGARGVIATLAPIEDVLAQQFSADFYTRYTAGASAVKALSETQRAWLAPAPGVSEADQLRRRITALSHAYFAG